MSVANNILPSGHTTIQHMEVRSLSKRFPGVLANDRINFDVLSGEVHALLGENGAGKSTLMKQLYGLYQPDEGDIVLDGEVVRFDSPAKAIAYGIGMIHQHFMLVDSLSVAENVALGLKSSRGVLLDLDSVKARIQELSKLYGLAVDPDALVWQLSVGEQQRVEIIKALYRGAALLILDEPTAVLTPGEVKDFFKTIKQMADDGHAIIFISHKLDEVMAFTDRVTVLRDGRNAGSCLTKDSSKRELATMMVGRQLKDLQVLDRHEGGKVVLSLQGISARSERNTLALDKVDLDIREGEILGLAGVSGNGQLELAEAITGLRPLQQGSVHFLGKDISKASVAERIASGMSFIPEERNRDGMVRDFNIAENLILREQGKAPFARAGFLQFARIEQHAQKMIQAFSVKTPSSKTPIKSLSGGNAQKVILARELSRKPKMLIAAQPTRGLDVGASEFVREQILEQRSKGTATLLISEDLDELLALSDRIAIIFHGKIMGVVNRADANLEAIGLMIAGEQAAPQA